MKIKFDEMAKKLRQKTSESEKIYGMVEDWYKSYKK
jgi:hypothetical protein